MSMEKSCRRDVSRQKCQSTKWHLAKRSKFILYELSSSKMIFNTEKILLLLLIIIQDFGFLLTTKQDFKKLRKGKVKSKKDCSIFYSDVFENYVILNSFC